MADSFCENWGGIYHWHWEEVFDKDGFAEGFAQVETWTVFEALTEVGYEVTVNKSNRFIQNTFIISIRKNGVELLPDGASAMSNNARTICQM